ncbi:MFS transporter [Escherichia coli]
MVTINTESALTPRSLRDTRRMNMFVSVAAAVAGLLFGLDIGVIAGALPFITDHFVLTSRLQEWVVSSMMLGAAIGALFNGWLSFRLGRKYSLMAGAILFVLGSIGSAFATSVENVNRRSCGAGHCCRDRVLHRSSVIFLKWQVKTFAVR